MAHQLSHPSHDHHLQQELQQRAFDAFVASARAPAEALWRERASLSAESQRLWQASDRAGAKACSERAHALAERAAQADAAAASAIFAQRQLHVRADEIDLHGLHVEEAERFLLQRLKDAGHQGGAAAAARALVVIYGQGHHSAGHKTHVKPAVLALLARQGLPVREGWHAPLQCANEGVCSVTLDGGAGGPSPSFDSGLRIKLPQDRASARPSQQADGGGFACCVIV